MEELKAYGVVLVICLLSITGTIVAADSLETDKEVLLSLKLYLKDCNRVNQGKYSTWHSNTTSSSPCTWPGISCSGDRVTGIDLSGSNIAGEIFGNFSALTALTLLDLSSNTLSGGFPIDLGQCHNLKVLNLSHNIISGELNLTGFSSLESLDLSTNRIFGDIRSSFPGICKNLVSINLSGNNLTGSIMNSFDECVKLQYLDLGANKFGGEIWPGFARLKDFSVSENYFRGEILPEFFGYNCSLRVLDLSENDFRGNLPKEISNCRGLNILNLWGNNFTGEIPSEIGNILGLEGLYLGNNSFSRTIPVTLLDLKNLTFLDLSRNHFGGDIQPIFGKFTQVKFLVLHSNSYTDGIYSSGILNLPNVSRLDLSFNNFTGSLPVQVSRMTNLKLFFLANNQFSGNIPPEYGHLPSLQSLDLSSNKLNGSIPSSFGNLSSLLWLMLANNELSGKIPSEIGNCKSLLWLNLANNRLSGTIPSEMTKIGLNATSTFELNRERDRVTAGSGECLAMKRWIPANYPPFSFAYMVLTRKSCRSLWDKLLKGYGIFPICANGKRTFQISGYVQLSGNQFSGEIPPEIGKMQNFTMIHIGFNNFSGNLPVEIAKMPLINLNVTRNNFSGTIPTEIGSIKCLQNLDLSYNNFSGKFPTSLSNLTELNKFNVSYNPYITGTIPTTGQLATFEKESFLGNPLLRLPSFLDNNSSSNSTSEKDQKPRKGKKLVVALVVFALITTFLACGIMTLIVCIFVKTPLDSGNLVLEDQKGKDLFTPSSSIDTVKIIRLDKTAFTHSDILNATCNFSDSRIIGKGGYGTVYRGKLPDGREIAVKKLQRDGKEGEREFRAEMEVLTGNGLTWPHPNLVALYGWCLDNSEKLLIYEYMRGGSLDNLIQDKMKLRPRTRLDIAIDIARALVFLHHECYPPIVHRDVKASNVLLDENGKRASVTDFGLARVVNIGDSHVSTMVAGTVGYVAPEYCHTWQATTKGDVYSFGVLAMELATARRAVSEGGDQECLVEWARRVVGPALLGYYDDNNNNNNNNISSKFNIISTKLLLGSWVVEGAEDMCELLKIGIRCTEEMPRNRPNMKEVLAMLVKVGLLTGL